MVNRIEEKRVNYSNGRKAGAPAPKKKTLAYIMKTGRRQANAAKKTAAETQEFLKWALQNCRNQGDLDAIRDLVATNGTPKQRKLFEKMEHDFAPELTKSQRRQEQAARITNKKFIKNENFRQAILNAESVDDLKALEKEYGKKLPQSLRTTYNSRLQTLEKAAAEQAAQHAEMQTSYQKLFGYGNGKHPSNTPLGNAQPTQSSGMNWTRYAQEHGGTYTKPLSGVGQADRMAEEAIARNIRHAELQAEYNKKLGYGGLHPSNTPLGTAQPTASSGLSAEQIAKKLGREYVKPEVSGVVKADRIAEEIIARNTRTFEIVIPESPTEIPPVAEAPIEKPPVVEAPIGNGGKKVKGKKGFKMPKLGKKGRFALGALAIGLIGAGIAYLTKSKKAAPTTPSGEAIKPGLVPVDTTKNEKVDTTVTTPITPIVNQVDTIEQKVVREIPRALESGKYIVRKGDNCWNIAKAELIKENGGEIPSDNEVMQRTYKILERNDLHYEKDKYTVLIYPNDTLDIRM